jgi:polysaccharide deacetylase family protein (PEP-CTERM system associated)
MATHALTIDLEDWHQLHHRRITAGMIPPTPAVVADTHRVLDLLDKACVRATFFVVGLVAKAYPDLVREVARRGHEIGSHTYCHQVISTMDRASFRADADRSIKQLQDLTGQPVLGFRAPEFSVKSLDHWTFEILADVGFRYDSSVYPLTWARYGIPEAPRCPFEIATPRGAIREFPLATWEQGGTRFPVAGGSYYRFVPECLLRRAMRDLDVEECPAVLYFHPYEFHEGRLRLANLSWYHRRRLSHIKYSILHNICTARIAHRLTAVLNQFDFAPLVNIFQRGSQQ